MNRQNDSSPQGANPFCPVDYKRRLRGRSAEPEVVQTDAFQSSSGESEAWNVGTQPPIFQSVFGQTSNPPFQTGSEQSGLSQRMTSAQGPESLYEEETSSLMNRMGGMQAPFQPEASPYQPESIPYQPGYFEESLPYSQPAPDYTPANEAEFNQPDLSKQQSEVQAFTDVPADMPREALPKAEPSKEEKKPKTAVSYVMYGVAAILVILIAVYGIRLIRILYTSEKNNASENLSGTRVELPQDGSPIDVSTVPAAVSVSSAVTKETVQTESFSSLRSARKSYETNPQMQLLSAVAELQKNNVDIVGRLTIEGIVDEPVLQGSKYLTLDPYGEAEGEGSCCTRDDCRFDVPVENLILFGKAGTTGIVFEPIVSCLTTGNFDMLLYAHLLTLYEEKDYVLLTVCPGQDSLPAAFSTDDEMKTWLRSMFSQSITVMNTDVQSTDSLLTLNVLGGSSEYVLIYRMLRNGETKTR